MGKRHDKLDAQVRIIHPEYDSLSPERQMQILSDVNNHYHSRRYRARHKNSRHHPGSKSNSKRR